MWKCDLYMLTVNSLLGINLLAFSYALRLIFPLAKVTKK